MMECRNSGTVEYLNTERRNTETWNAGILKHGTVVKILTIGTRGFSPHKCSGQKRKYKAMVKYEPFYCRKKGCCYSSW